MGRQIVEEVHEELKETAQRLWNTTDITDIFERLSNDRIPALREPRGDARPRPARGRRG